MQRVKIHNVVKDQLPEFVQQSYPEFESFIEEYYKAFDENNLNEKEKYFIKLYMVVA